MKRLTGFLVVSVLLLGAGTPSLSWAGGDKKGEQVKETEYYPLKVGSSWEYLVSGKKVVVKVTKNEPVKVAGSEVMCSRVETDSGGTILVEHLYVKDEGVYRAQANGQAIEPPYLVLKLPTKKGDSWVNNCKAQNFVITSKLTTDEGKVTVNKKDYDAYIVGSTEMKIGQQDATVKTWFAKGVGIVKQHYTVAGAGLDTTIELDKYVPPK